jgi:hypothetical protein
MDGGAGQFSKSGGMLVPGKCRRHVVMFPSQHDNACTGVRAVQTTSCADHALRLIMPLLRCVASYRAAVCTVVLSHR